MNIGVRGFLSNVNTSSVNVFITTMNSGVAEASICTMKYFNDASVMCMFLTLDIREIYDIRFISKPIHAPRHELENTDTNAPPTKVMSKRTLLIFWALEKRMLCSIYGV